MKYIARSLASGLVVYVVAAACGASERAASVVDDGGGPAAVADALVDGIAHPVGEASAEPLPPDVAEENCVIRKYNGQDAYVAEHSYPGKSAVDLAAVRATVTITAELEGYTQRVGYLVYVRDGSAAVWCAHGSGPAGMKATFILPR